MKNQTAKFTSGTDATLTIRLSRGKTDWKVQPRLREPEKPVQIGKADYIDLGNEADAQAMFDRRVKEAVAAGWQLQTRAERAPAFTTIPQAPKATAPKAVAAGRR